MKEIFYALYFALHFVGAFLGLIIAIHVSTWLGLSMFAFFIIKFLIMMPDVMEKEINGHLYITNDNLKRIADALEEILRLVKKDMGELKKVAK